MSIRQCDSDNRAQVWHQHRKRIFDIKICRFGRFLFSNFTAVTYSRNIIFVYTFNEAVALDITCASVYKGSNMNEIGI